MNMITMPAAEARYSIEAQIRFTETFLSALKNYWKTNSSVIVAGLASLGTNYAA